MAAYFGESDSILFNVINVASPAAISMEAGLDKSMQFGKSPQSLASPGSIMREASREIFFDDDSDDIPDKICKESGLPYKSPMAAYFDGDGLDDFSLVTSPEANYIPSPTLAFASPATVSGNLVYSSSWTPTFSFAGDLNRLSPCTAPEQQTTIMPCR